MTGTCVVISKPIDGETATTLVRTAETASAAGVPLLLFGAFARDVLFWHMHGIEPGRRTTDVDISVQLPDWETYDELGRRLDEAGFVRPDEGHPEKLRDSQTGRQLDLLPFGGIARDGRTVVWREDNSAWSVVGLQDAFDHALLLAVESGGTRCEVPLITIPALVMLKVVAVHDRPSARFKKDGTDVGFVIRHYLDVGNRERLAGPDGDVMDRTGSDLDLASAMLIGRDIRAACSAETREYVLGLLEREISSRSRCPLVRGMRVGWGGEFRRARVLLAALAEELAGSTTASATAVGNRVANETTRPSRRPA
jgi:predicted nucleotidyltransferase